ncbi:2869_t:CDS:1 [Cetraspora pellucida]|uniref:2869_t:CDS:1 n=1 Tax=Cetraspora pellucida TaxID=1433469 RepID=A0A9N9HT52_9GLOM|nr:2869_t:CDS:1 [Cetraspora pellucida]
MVLNDYNPLNDTINVLQTIFVTVIVVGLFRSFEKDKQKDISFINIFDDLIIFSSVVTYPLINGLQWFSYYTENNKHKFVTTLYIIIPVWIIYYVLWLAAINVEIKTINDDIDILLKDQKSQIIENYEDKVEGDEAIKINDKKNVKDYSLKVKAQFIIQRFYQTLKINSKDKFIIFHTCLKKIFCYMEIYFMIFFIGFQYQMIIYGDIDNSHFSLTYVSGYCAENFGVNKCRNLNITLVIVQYICIIILAFDLVYHSFYLFFTSSNSKLSEKLLTYYQKNNNWLNKHYYFNRFIVGFNHIVIIAVITCPAVISGFLLSTNSYTTKIAFALYSLSLARLLDHFGDTEPKKVKTMISFYLNWHARMIKNDEVEKIKNKLEKQTKKLNKITHRCSDANIKKEVNDIRGALENQKEDLADIILNYDVNKINDIIMTINLSLLCLIEKMTILNYNLRQAQNSEAVKIQSSETKKNNEIKARDKNLIIIDLAIVRKKIIMVFVSLQDFYKKINLDNKPDKDLKTEQIMINIEKNSTKTKIEIKEEILNLLEDFKDFGDNEDDEQVKEISA